MIEKLRARGHATSPVRRSLPADRFYRPSEFIADRSQLNLETLITVAREAQVAKLIVIKRVAPDRRGPHQRFFEGAYGLYHRDLFGIQRSSVYALIGVAVVDVNKASVVAQYRGAAWNGWANNLPTWAPNLEDMSQEDRAALRQSIEGHLVGELKTIASQIPL